MKKFYLFTIGLLGLFVTSNGQVIEVLGVGMVDQTSATLTFSDISNISGVTVGAIYKGPDGIAPEGTVNFDDADEGPSSTWMPSASIVDMNPTSEDPYIGYWTADFTSADAGGIEAVITDVDDEAHILSYYAYVYRNDPTATFISYASTETVFFYHNGSANPYVYNIPINTAPGLRDITVKVPISELDNGNTGRVAVIDIAAGSVSLPTIEVLTWNISESFFLGSYTLTDVPGDVSNVTVSIYSPTFAEGDGDSFFVNGVVANVDIYDGGCTYTQGYWKTHSVYGPASPADPTWDLLQPSGPDSPFYLSGTSWYEVFWTPVKGNKYYSLAHQFMATQLNFLNGADPSAIQAAYDAAKVLFETYTPTQVKNSSELKNLFGSYIDIFTDYNEGTIGPGHCGGNKFADANIDAEMQKLVVYPNPISNYGTLDFIAAENANTTVEIYNLVGSRVDVLFDDYVEAEAKTSLSIDASKYPKGMYIVVIRNGSTIFKEKLSVMN